VAGDDRALFEPVVRGVDLEELVAGEGRDGFVAVAGRGRALGFVMMRCTLRISGFFAWTPFAPPRLLKNDIFCVCSYLNECAYVVFRCVSFFARTAVSVE